MPYYVVERLAETVDRSGKPFSSSRVLMLGVAYKKNVDDTRESPSLKLIELIEARGAKVDYHDPHIPELPTTRKHGSLAGRRSVVLTPDNVRSYDAVLIATDHDGVDYRLVIDNSNLVVDTRNVCARVGIVSDRVFKV
jgi:UDP-N-acetyl-D-glucosamine dehydrogenase